MRTITALILISLLCSCSSEIVINNFSKLPDEVGGPGCIYSATEAGLNKQQFVFADGDGVAYMKINGELEKLEFQDYIETPKFYKEIYKNGSFEVTIARRKHKHPIELTEDELAAGSNETEVYRPDKASITVKSGAKTTSIKVFGECSCC